MEHDENAPLELAIDPVQARKAEHRGREAQVSPLENATSVRGPVLRRGMGTAVRSFGIGTVLSESISLLFQRGIPFLGLLAVTQVSLGALFAVVSMTGGNPRIAPLLLGPVQMLVASFMGTAIAIGTLRAMQGQPVGAMEAIRLALHKPLARTAGLALLYFLGVIGAALLATLLVVLGKKLSPGPQGLAIGYVLAAVAFVAVASQLWLLLPVVVAETTPLMACFRRSAALIKGYHLPTMGLVLIPLLLIGTGFVFFPNVQPGETGRIALVFLVLVPLILVFACICSTVSYTELRAIQEGVALEDIHMGMDDGAAYTRHHAWHAEPTAHVHNPRPEHTVAAEQARGGARPVPAERRSSQIRAAVLLAILAAALGYIGYTHQRIDGAKLAQRIEEISNASSPLGILGGIHRVECPDNIRANSDSDITCTGFVQGFAIPLEVILDENQTQIRIKHLPPGVAEAALQALGKKLEVNRTFDCGSAPIATTPNTTHICRCTNCGRASGQGLIEFLANDEVSLKLEM